MITVLPCIDKSANNDISPLASQMTVLKTPGVLFFSTPGKEYLLREAANNDRYRGKCHPVTQG